MGNPVDNTSSVLNARKDDIKSSTKISFDNTLVKSLDTLTTFSGVTFTSSEVGKCYLYVGNENGYVTNAIYKITKDGNNYLPQLDNSLSPSNKVDKLNLGSTVNNSLVKITTNAQGQVTGSSNVTASDIPGLSSKQDTIDTNNKLSSDLVDDTNHDHKFVTETDKSNWNNKVDKYITQSILWTDSTEPNNQGKPLNTVLFKPSVFTESTKIKIKSFSINIANYDDMYSGDVYIKLLDSNNNILSLSNGVALVKNSEISFDLDTLVSIDKDTQYKIGFYSSKTGSELLNDIGFKVNPDISNNELYVRNNNSEFKSWRPITKFEYYIVPVTELIKVAVNDQGLVINTSEVSESDIPNLVEDLDSKVDKINTIVTHEDNWTDNTGPNDNSGGLINFTFKPSVFASESKIRIKSIEIKSSSSVQNSGTRYLKLQTVSGDKLAMSDGNTSLNTTDTYGKFTLDTLVELDSNTEYRVTFCSDSEGNIAVGTALRLYNSAKDGGPGDDQDIYCLPYATKVLRPLTKFEYEYDEIVNEANNQLVKITTNLQGQVIGTSEVTDSDIPTLPQSKVTNLESDLSSKQPTIDSTHKLSSDLVDDTNHDHKFVSQSNLTDLSNLKTTVGDSNSGLVKDVSDLQTAVGQVNTLLSSI